MIPLNIKLFSTSGASKTITKTIKDSYNNSYTVTISLSETLADDYITTNKSLLSGSVVVSNTGGGGAYTSSKAMTATLTFKNNNESGDTLLTKTGSCKFDFQGSATKIATPLSFSDSELSHSSDGTLTLYVQIQLKITETSLKQTQNWTDSITLTSIPRASTLNSFTSTNSTATYGYTKKNSSFYDVITFTSNGKTLGTVNNPKSSAGTYSGLTKSYDMSKVLEAATAAGNGTITVTCTIKTYSEQNGTLIGSSSLQTPITLGSSSLSSVVLAIATNGTATIKPTISKWNADTYDVLYVYGNNFSQTFSNVSSGTTHALNNSSLFAAMGTNTYLSLNCVLYTYSEQNGANLGTSSQNNKQIYLPTYNITASVNSYSDLNNSSTPGSMGYALSTFKPNTQTMIKYLSNPKITFKVASSTGYLYGRKISTTGASIQTNLSHNSTFDVEPGTNFVSNYSITATDGRKSGSTNQTFTVVPYFTPTVTCSLVRPLPTSSTANVTIVVKYYNDTGSFLTNKKTINNSNGSLVFKYTEKGGSEITKTYSNFTISNSTSGATTTMTATLQLTGLDPSKSISYSVVFKDLITYQAKANGTIPNGQPVLSVYRKDVKNYAKINGDLMVRGETIVDSIRSKNLLNNFSFVKGRITSGTLERANYVSSIVNTKNSVAFTTTSTWSGISSDFIEVKQGNYTISGVPDKKIFYYVEAYNSSKVWQSRLVENNASSSFNYTFSIPSGIKYIRLVFQGNVADTYTITNLIIENGSTATTYSPYQELDIDNLAKQELVVGNIRGSNLFNYTMTPVYYANTSVMVLSSEGIRVVGGNSGATYSSALYKVLDIDNYLGKTITLSCNINIATGQPRISIGTCDSSGGNRTNLVTKDVSSNGRYSVSTTLPSSTTSTTKYLMVGLYISHGTAPTSGNYCEFTNIQLNIGEDTTYTPYQNLNGMETYSTNEQVVGTWIDGKPIYRRVYQTTSPSTAGGNNTIVQIANQNIIKIDGVLINSSTQIMPINWYMDSTRYICTFQNSSTQITMKVSSSNQTSKPVYIILEYTKTTD